MQVFVPWKVPGPGGSGNTEPHTELRCNAATFNPLQMANDTEQTVK